MRLSSQAPASQRRLGRTPSSQKESELRSRNGALAEQRQRPLDAAAGLKQRVALVGDDDLRRAAGLQMRLDPVGEMVDVDDGRLDAGRGEAVEAMVDQRAAADLDERLRQRSPKAAACACPGRRPAPSPFLAPPSMTMRPSPPVQR